MAALVRRGRKGTDSEKGEEIGSLFNLVLIHTPPFLLACDEQPQNQSKNKYTKGWVLGVERWAGVS